MTPGKRVSHQSLCECNRDAREHRLRLLLRRVGLSAAECDRISLLVKRHFLNPIEFASKLRSLTDRKVIVNGTFDQRIVLVANGDGWEIAWLGQSPLSSLSLPTWAHKELSGAAANPVFSVKRLSDRLVRRLERPRILLAALCHPENFPLPRFPLGISDLAWALRREFIGQTELMDMQLGTSIQDICSRIEEAGPDIVGISATFGQHDVLVDLMHRICSMSVQPLIVFGGSLCALDKGLIAERFPGFIICTGSGESTIRDIALRSLGEISSAGIRGVFPSLGDGASHAPQSRLPLTVIPELDLLEDILLAKGVMQIESTRGCTNTCSFCPRQHKGRWIGFEPRDFQSILSEVESLYRRFPKTSNKLFLVDEEFIGIDSKGTRAREMAHILNGAGFRWETSSRIDQVYREKADYEWSIERIGVWRELGHLGLNRCLFGVESGVRSVLKRFNKMITPTENTLGIRILTALGIPIRCTYITFDPLMTFEELTETYEYQGRTDILLRPLPDKSAEEIYDLVSNNTQVQQVVLGQPLYSVISYMLVSMECLVGSPYLQQVEHAGLARELQPSMARRRSNFLDPRIGRMSEWSQRWIDRNFSLDYTLKSLQKISDETLEHEILSARIDIKHSSYHLLGTMLSAVTSEWSHIGPGDGLGPVDSSSVFECLLETSSSLLRDSLRPKIDVLTKSLDTTKRPVLEREWEKWQARETWELISN